MRHFAWLIAIFISATAPTYAEDSLIISEPWVREGPPSATVLAGYLKLRNTSPQSVTLTHVSSPQFQQVEIHETVFQNGLARMKKHNELSVVANSEVLFEPNGFHLMLIDPLQPVRVDQAIELIFNDNNGNTHRATATVKPVSE